MSDHENVGTEVFDAELFYSLSRPSRAKLTQVWREHGDEHEIATGESPGALIGQFVGAVEDVLWRARERKLTSLVLEAAAARKERRDVEAARLEGIRGGMTQTIEFTGDAAIEAMDVIEMGMEMERGLANRVVGNVDTDGINDDPMDGER